MPSSEQQYNAREMIQEVDRFVDGLVKAAKSKLKMPSGFNKMCICGMGGSAMSGDIIADAVLASWDVPVQVIRSTRIPNWFDENTLVVASSYSGNTKETLMMYDQAQAKGCTMVVITSGGELGEKCLKDGNKLIMVPGSMQPRSAIGYTIGYLANIIEAAGGPKIKTELIKLMPTLRKFRGSIWMRNAGSLAKQIAERMHGTVPAIYATGSLSAAAVRWKNQINENSKMMAFNGAIPEMNHNEIVGWSECVQRSKCRPVFLCEQEMTDTERSMLNESIDILMSSGLDVEKVTIWGTTALEKSLKAVMLGDYVSLFLAAMNNVDPMDIGPIVKFKQKLAMLLSRKKVDKPDKKKKSKKKADSDSRPDA
ncbi:MAG: bifunctional phosphoglucose/phosphomannose isomerase [Methanomassiliicoccaceae archaeon]|jgi:glucose/mannose-6-phosphate isomerase|nr:bifunctional phosphoglucose/phosphomannose isomerase [Methanomassiliicoccaceae archaeon]